MFAPIAAANAQDSSREPPDSRPLTHGASSAKAIPPTSAIPSAIPVTRRARSMSTSRSGWGT
jgi:hypothetical protein